MAKGGSANGNFQKLRALVRSPYNRDHGLLEFVFGPSM